MIAISAPFGRNGATVRAGRVLLYQLKNDNEWSYETILGALDAAPADKFGSTIFMTPDSSRIFVAASAATSDVVDSGKVYVFERTIPLPVVSAPLVDFQQLCAMSISGTTDPGDKIAVYVSYSDEAASRDVTFEGCSARISINADFGETKTVTANEAGFFLVEDIMSAADCAAMRIQALFSSSCLVSPPQAIRVA